MSAFTIHIEGMDLAGKTAAGRGLARRLGNCQVRNNSLCEFNPVFSLADRLRKNSELGDEALGHLFVAALAADMELYQAPTVPTIQDSTILLRSLAFHRVNGTRKVVESLEGWLPLHPRFAHSIVLTASLASRHERLKSRRLNAPEEVAADDLMIERDPQKFLGMESELIELSREHFGATVIDTSQLTEVQVVDRVVELVDLFHLTIWQGGQDRDSSF